MSDRRRGQTPAWTPDSKLAVLERVCERIAAGESLRTICADPWMPSRVSVLEWVRSEPELGRRYRLALEERTHMRTDRQDRLQGATALPVRTGARGRVMGSYDG